MQCANTESSYSNVCTNIGTQISPSGPKWVNGRTELSTQIGTRNQYRQGLNWVRTEVGRERGKPFQSFLYHCCHFSLPHNYVCFLYLSYLLLPLSSSFLSFSIYMKMKHMLICLLLIMAGINVEPCTGM